MDNNLVNFNRRKDRISEIDVRVDTVEQPREFGDARIVYFKFMVANEKALRIQCMALEEQIDRIKPLVKKNTVIRIKGAISKRETNPKFNDGDVPFVLMICANTVITVIQHYDDDVDNEGNSECNFGNYEPSHTTLERFIARVESDHITTAINNNTVAMKELAETLKEGLKK